MVPFMRLHIQLFLTLLIASALLITMLFVINSWTFSRGFTSYVNQTRLAPLVSELAYMHERDGGWPWAADEARVDVSRRPPRQWLELIAKLIEGQVRTLTSEPRDRVSPGADANTASEGVSNDQVAADEDSTGVAGQTSTGQSSRSERRERRAQRENRDRPGREQSRQRVRHVAGTLVLADENREPLLGNINPARLNWLPIEGEVAEGKRETLGYLGYRKNRRFEGLLHSAFEKSQRKTFALAAVGLALLSALLSFPLARRLVRPIDEINTAVGNIRNGSYDTRLALKRKDELGDLSTSINSLAETLDANQSARQRWIAELSHELRTPLAILRGELEALQDGVRPLDENAINGLHDQSRHLSRLVDDLHTLSVSDIGALDYRFQNCKIGQLLTDFVEARRLDAETKSLTLSLNIEGDPLVRLDQGRFEQLLINLFQNSLRYTETGGLIEIDVRRRDQQVWISWSDSAPGVPEQQLNELFEPFYRAESSRSRASGGSGLGLAIVKRIVDAHDAEIRALESKLGGLELQFEARLASLLVDYLQRENYTTEHWDNGTTALAQLKQQIPDLVLLDLMLPGTDGLSICRELRKVSEVPIIMLTARVEEIDRLLGLDLGADDYICKPYSPREVVARVKAVLRRVQSASSREQNGETATACYGQSVVSLTAVELRLLQVLSATPGRIYNREQLMRRIYADNRVVSDRTIDSHIKKLRQKLQGLDTDLSFIQSVYGLGYKFDQSE